MNDDPKEPYKPIGKPSQHTCEHCHAKAEEVCCKKCTRSMCEECISYHSDYGQVCGLCLDRINGDAD